MSRTGLCSVCEAATANNQCDRCGALVCREHYDVSAEACVECARGGRRDVGDRTFQF